MQRLNHAPKRSTAVTDPEDVANHNTMVITMTAAGVVGQGTAESDNDDTEDEK